VLVSAKRLRDKHIEIGKREIEDVALVENAPLFGQAEAPPKPRLVDTSDEEDAPSAA
jgi:DNA recombination protein RmuC